MATSIWEPNLMRAGDHDADEKLNVYDRVIR